MKPRCCGAHPEFAGAATPEGQIFDAATVCLTKSGLTPSLTASWIGLPSYCDAQWKWRVFVQRQTSLVNIFFRAGMPTVSERPVGDPLLQ
jgi:hypothetical protein